MFPSRHDTVLHSCMNESSDLIHIFLKQALLFVLFSILLQLFDAYILKPKLFSNSLGASGLLILFATIVFGSMFGVWGMLLAIPAAAILSFLYHDYFLPRREKQMQEK